MSLFKSRKQRMEEIQQKLAELDAADDALVTAFEEMLKTRAPAEAPGVDISAVKAADPTFDDQAFLSIARESFFQMTEAREHHRASIAADLTDAKVAADLEATIAADAAAHKYHVLPGVEIQSAVITSAAVTDGKISIVVRMHLVGKEEDLDENANVVAIDEQYKQWDEEWTFTRDPNVDESAEDARHALLREEDGGWDFAHKGWNVTAIARVQ
jgi:predicted lipid-binding transport protein (Tim44 family)